jgi:hypothetical protein
MGQYHYTVNLDKHEYLNPHDLGDGLKLGEFGRSEGGVLTALTVLLACSDGRGGGDFDQQDTEWGGRWAGDRIAIVGDYAEDADLPPEFHAGSIYARCGDEETEIAWTREFYERGFTNLTRKENNARRGAEIRRIRAEHAKWRKLGLPTFTNISPGVRTCLEDMGYRFSGTGWLTRTIGDGEPATPRLVPDMIINIGG